MTQLPINTGQYVRHDKELENFLSRSVKCKHVFTM